MEQPTLWALLVGIDDYASPNVRNLRGCVNDVEAMHIFLMTRYAVSEDHICVLTNEQATRTNILGTFQSFLIDNPQIQYGDQILFHYSGHGSQMPAGQEDYEPDGLNETIVPHDSRQANVFDIPDKTLAALIERLADAKGDQITTIFDSCHSGSITRDLDNPLARRIPTDERIPPTKLDSELRNYDKPDTRAVGSSGWATAKVPYVLLAGCRDYELSNEYKGRVEDSYAWHGALTYFILQVLREFPQVPLTRSYMNGLRLW